MPSKGVDCYAYIAAPGCSVEFSVPGTNLIRNQLKVFTNDHLEVDKYHLHGVLNYIGTFSFRVMHGDSHIASESVIINVITGNLEDGTMREMDNQVSTVTDDVIVTSGFYHAGRGAAGLPNSHQCFVTVTPNYSNWMGQIAPSGSAQAAQPFSHLMLPAAHDIGMNSMKTTEAVLASSALVEVMTGISPIFARIAGTMTHSAVVAIAPNIIRGLAITQKDSLATILSLGARYFEFRPAYLHAKIRGKAAVPDVLYFSHSAIPGMPYAEFLQGVVSFLRDHPEEIVVVQLRWDGVPAECAQPTADDLQNYINDAIVTSDGSVSDGSLDDLRNMTIEDLRSQQKRLIWFMPTDSFSTYTDQANATLNGDSIINQFNCITRENQAGKQFTNLQCQATATNIPEAVVYSVLAVNASSSVLLATKPICDSKTLPWIVANTGRLDPAQLVVVMNDFFDGATADVAIDWSRRRLEGAF